MSAGFWNGGDSRLRVGPGCQQQRNDLCVTIARRDHQRGQPDLTDGVHICPMTQQPFDSLLMPLSSEVERGQARIVSPVHLKPFGHTLFQQRHVSRLSRPEQAQLPTPAL